MYGLGAASLSLELGISKDEAATIIERFTTRLEGFAALKGALQAELRSGGRIRLVDGRRLQVGIYRR